MLLGVESNFFVLSLRYYSVLVFNFSDIKPGYKITSQVFNKNLRNQRTLIIKKIISNYCKIVQKLPMLKQGWLMLNLF